MEQQELMMVEDVYEAIKQAGYAIAVYHEPKKRESWKKVIGSMLWPTKDPDDAAKLWSNCVDKTRPEKLDPEQYLWLKREAKRCGCHILHAFDCDFTEYQRSNPIEPKDEVVDLFAQFQNGQRSLERLADRLEKIMSGDGLHNLPERPRVVK